MGDYIPPLGEVAAAFPQYEDEDLPGTLGSTVPALGVEIWQRELLNVLTVNGVTPDAGSIVQLEQAIEKQIEDKAHTYTRQQVFFPVAILAFGANIAWNHETQQVADVILTGNAQLDDPTLSITGGRYSVRIQQDGVGGHALTLGASYRSVGAFALPGTAANTASFIHVRNHNSVYFVTVDGPYTL